MPQWSRDRAADDAKYPDERARADAPPAHRALLRRYDHHVVRLAGRPALLLTYQWDLAPRPPDVAWSFDVSFTYAPGHPGAPAAVQAVVDSLTFAPVLIATQRANER